MKRFNLSIYASDRVFYEGPAEYVNIPTPDGMYGILADHTNTICSIVPGRLTVSIADVKEEVIVSKGLFKIEEGDVLVLVHTCERPDEIDEKRAQRAKAEAERKLKQKLSKQEYHEAEAALARALNRLKNKKDKDKIL